MPAITVRQNIPRDSQSSRAALPATIVLLHGWGFDSRIWQPLVNTLNQWAELCLIDIDYKGQTVTSLCDDIVEVLPEQSLLIGWSLGGMLAANIIAQSLAEKKNKSVIGFVSLAANLKFVATDTWLTAMPPSTFSAFVNGAEKNSLKQLKRFNVLVAQGDSSSREQCQWLQNEMSITSPDKQSLLDGLSILNTIDNTQSLKYIRIPSLLLFGDNDQLVPSDVVDQLPIDKRLHQCHLLSNKGHCLHFPKGECHTLIDQFIEQLACD